MFPKRESGKGFESEGPESLRADSEDLELRATDESGASGHTLEAEDIFKSLFLSSMCVPEMESGPQAPQKVPLPVKYNLIYFKPRTSSI